MAQGGSFKKGGELIAQTKPQKKRTHKEKMESANPSVSTKQKPVKASGKGERNEVQG
mgnify:CR=1 FL=1